LPITANKVMMMMMTMNPSVSPCAVFVNQIVFIVS